MRLLYLGLPLGAIVLARAGFRPDIAVIGHPEAPGMRRVRAMGKKGTLVLARPDLGAPDVLRALASAKPDVIVSFFFPKKISKSVLDLAPRGAFGAHPSLLPRYRGPDPYFWCLKNGDAVTGATLHRLEEDYDTGAIIETREVAIPAGITAFALARRLDRPALAMLVSCMQRLEAGETLDGAPQPTRGISYAPSPSEDDTWIDWHASAEVVERLVRACAPYPGAGAELDGTSVEIERVRIATEPAPRALEAAEAYRTAEGEVAVKCGAGAVVLERVRALGGETLDAAELLGLVRPEQADDQA